MAIFKVSFTIFFVLLIGEKTLGVLNKGSSKNINNAEDNNTIEDRITHDYGAPPRPHFDGPAPVYGPPQQTGNHGPQHVYPPPPADIPPPLPSGAGHGPGPRPQPFYGPPRNIPQLQFGQRPVKLSPWKLFQSPSRFVTKPAGHGPPIPISFESYGLPSNQPPPNFSRHQNQYGPPQPFPILPPVPQVPPPGVAAPPTPPVIKYDGWQPIAGNVETPNTYKQLESYNANVNIPSNSYGEPIRSQEDHNLRQAVAPSNSDTGLPPPKLPADEPLHNIQDPIKDIQTLPKPNLPPFFTSFENDIINHISSHDDLSFNQQNQQQQQQQQQEHQQQQQQNQQQQQQQNQQQQQQQNQQQQQQQQQQQNQQEQPQQQQSLPGVSDSYGAPSPPSFPGNNGPYPPSQGPSGFGESSFNQQIFKQQHRQQHSFNNNFSYQRNQPSFRPHSPPGAFSLPRIRQPPKFRESVPSSLLNSIHRYRQFGQGPPPPPPPPSSLPSAPGNFGRPNINFQQQPPIPNNAVKFNEVSTTFDNNHSPLAVPNFNYGTPLTFTNFNTPSPILTYGAPNFGPSGSFLSATIGENNGNLYQQNAVNGLSMVYGSPNPLPASQFQFNGRPNDCSQKNLGLNTFNNLEQTQFRQINSEVVPTIDSNLQLPLISQLELEPHNTLPQTDIKDSYGNPAGVTSDLRSAPSSQVGIGHTAEALTASQGYNQQQSSNQLSSTNELNIDQLSQLHSEPALALAQTLTAEGASDGFQIQGSKGTYTLQVQPAEPQANENSDGTIRHDRLLSNGLLQDILAAIEQPGQGGSPQLISIQGSPQSQPIQEVNDQKNYESHQDLTQSASSAAVSSETNNNDNNSSPSPTINDENVALFFNNNNNFEESNKEIRSTSKSEGVVGETTSEKPSESEKPSQEAS